MVRPLADDPARFAEDMLAGFVAAYPEHVRQVDGGVVRARPTRPGKVAVVVGGGSGHYPAFCGVVGPGFADGAVVGNVFTSPSKSDVLGVVRGCASEAGAVVLTGNYAGDVMNFSLAEAELCAQGIPTRYLVVTDDVASAPPEEAERRRGIAGDFPVFKIAAARAEEGASLEEVVEIAERANAATRTLGVAFDGCTMPGASEPLFTVAPGTMGLGVGIHGEPGIGEAPMPTASELAALLVERLLAETPQGASERVAVVLNGLGRTKYEELFVLWGRVLPLLREAGLTVVGPQVGELVTSLDMAGCSLTLTWLDEDLERTWLAPCDTPAFRRAPQRAEQGLTDDGAPGEATRAADGASWGDGVSGAASAGGSARTRAASEGMGSPTTSSGEVLASSGRPPSREDREAAPVVLAALRALEAALVDAEPELAALDAVAGDGDHGRGMLRGVRAALDAGRAAEASGAGACGILDAAGAAWADRAGGTSGVLWGAMLRAIAAEATPPVDLACLARAVRAGVDAVASLGGARLGDKTMLDVALPVVEEVERSAAAAAVHDPAELCSRVSVLARSAAEATAALTPRIGRARPLAARSVGTPDPGAVSFARAVEVVGGVLAGSRPAGSAHEA